MLGFGFTHCTDVCPVTLATLRRRGASWVGSRPTCRSSIVTVDPERDSPARMKEYLAPSIRLSSAPPGPGELAAVRKDYGIAAEKVSAAAATRLRTPPSLT